MASSVRIADGQIDFSEGVDSGRVTTIENEANPNGLKRSQLAWLTNGTVRGGGILCRTGWKKVVTIRPTGELYQGGYMYDAAQLGGDPYLVVSISGIVYRVRVDTDNSVEDISSPLINPATEPQAYFVQGEEFLVVQAGDLVTKPLFWDGATFRRSNGYISPTNVDPSAGLVNELPPAGPMDYYQGRIFYAIGRLYTGSDVVRSEASGTLAYEFRDSILKTTENNLALAGDGFTVPTNAGNIRALKHTANLDTALGQGAIYPFTRKVIYAAEIPAMRTEWVNLKEPVQRIAQITNGTYSDRSVVQVNGDLFYSAPDGIRSLLLAIRNFGQWGNLPISRNINRALQFNDRALMRYASGIQFSNRMLQTILPKQTDEGVVFQGVAVLDFDIISSMQSRLPPSWEGMYEGLDFLQLFEADFGGRQRAFGVVRSRTSGDIELWELTESDRFDDADKDPPDGDKRITWFFETPAFTWGDPFELKQLDGGEIWIDKLYGTVEMTVFYRVDADACWNYWFATQFCSSRNSCEDVTNPACYPEQPYREGYRFPIILPKPPSPPCKTQANRPANQGYQFQMKIILKGWCRIRGMIWYSLPVQSAPFVGLQC